MTQTQPLPAITGYGHARDGRTLYTVASRSHPGKFHLVTVKDEQKTCDCEAAHYGKPCAHLEAVTIKLKAKAKVVPVSGEYAPLYRPNAPFSIFKVEGTR